MFLFPHMSAGKEEVLDSACECMEVRGPGSILIMEGSKRSWVHPVSGGKIVVLVLPCEWWEVGSPY